MPRYRNIGLPTGIFGGAFAPPSLAYVVGPFSSHLTDYKLISLVWHVRNKKIASKLTIVMLQTWNLTALEEAD